MEHEAIKTDKAAPPAGHYNQGIKWQNLVFTSSVGGQRNPTRGDAPAGDIRVITANALENLKAILEAGGSGLDYVLHVTLYLGSLDNFEAINQVYATYFTGTRPARSRVLVNGPADTVSFDAVAYVPEQS